MESLGRSPKPEPAPAPIVTGSKPHMLYNSLLYEHAQRMRKSFPNYHTRNEGYDHQPKFRSTVSFNGEIYTSPNTFTNLKMAEMDVSEIAYFDMIQKSKSEALRHIQEDKTICKSVMIEYAAKMGLGRPKYATNHQGGAISAFRSHLTFNEATFPGEIAKSKKEAEQLVARAVILNYLDSEYSNDMAEVINSKFKLIAEIRKFEEVNNNATNVVKPQPCIPEVPKVPTAPATPVVMTEPTDLAPPVVTQPCIAPVVTQPCIPVTQPCIPPVVIQPQISEVVTQPIPSAAPVVTQPLTPKVPTKPNPSAAPVVTQPLTPKVMTKPVPPAAPVVTHPRIPKTEPIPTTAPTARQTLIPKMEPNTPPPATSVTHSRVPKAFSESVSRTVPVVTQLHQERIRPVVHRPAVLAPTPSQVNMVASAANSGKFAGNPSVDHSMDYKPPTIFRRPVVIAQTPSAQVNRVASAPHTGQSVEHQPVTRGRKRYWKDDKNAEKKMRADPQRPVPSRHPSPVQPFQSQSSRTRGNNGRIPQNPSRR